MAGSWRKLRNEELHNLYSSPNTIRMIQVEEVTKILRQNSRFPSLDSNQTPEALPLDPTSSTIPFDKH
jgi:hypothetical protein